MPITALPTPPSRSDTVNFASRGDSFLGALPTFVTEANALETNVNNKESSATTSANTATTKAGEALTSANNAATSKTGADTARDAAVVARTAAEAALDSFDDRYLGAKATAPTLDNDGAALLVGALYWDTALPGMRSWNGTAWVTLPAATAAAISNTPAGGVTESTVQGAIDGLEARKAALAGANFTGALQEGGKQTYNRGNVLGTVSQSAGVPTGAVIERGSNASGEYVRFADGTQICTARISTSGAITILDGSVYRTVTSPWTFPSAFIAIPAFHATPRVNANFIWGGLGGSAVSTTGASFAAFSPVSSAGVPEMSLTATGRWF